MTDKYVNWGSHLYKLLHLILSYQFKLLHIELSYVVNRPQSISIINVRPSLTIAFKIVIVLLDPTDPSNFDALRTLDHIDDTTRSEIVDVFRNPSTIVEVP